MEVSTINNILKNTFFFILDGKLKRMGKITVDSNFIEYQSTLVNVICFVVFLTRNWMFSIIQL